MFADVAAPADAPPYATLVLRAEQLSTDELEAVEADLHRAGRSELGLADDEEAAEDHTDWLNASFPVPKVPRVS